MVWPVVGERVDIGVELLVRATVMVMLAEEVSVAKPVEEPLPPPPEEAVILRVGEPLSLADMEGEMDTLPVALAGAESEKEKLGVLDCVKVKGKVVGMGEKVRVSDPVRVTLLDRVLLRVREGEVEELEEVEAEGLVEAVLLKDRE